MDIRKEKTQSAIKNAFLELHARKALEKITIKELCTLAQINKSTFYSHYDDIYDLSDQLQRETVAYVLSTMSHSSEYFYPDPGAFTRSLFDALTTHSALISSLFSGREQGQLVEKLEEGIKELVYRRYPGYRSDPEMQVLLTYAIYGGYYAYLNHQNVEEAVLRKVIENISEVLRPLYKGHL